MDLKHRSGFNDNYDLGNLLGSGAFSDVVEGMHKYDQSEYAIKIVYKDNLDNEDEIKEEINILNSLHHQHIVKLFSVYNDPDAYYIVTELLKGGELYDRIESKTAYLENEARDVCRSMLDAVGYCHKNNIAHRDLKPENLILVHQYDDTFLKIIDFGFAKRVTSPTCLRTQCGTMDYTAPEVLQGKRYGTQADMWSVGVILYLLLCGYEPFSLGTTTRRRQKILAGIYEFDKVDWLDISDEAKNLVRCLLNVRPLKRYNADDALKHPWFLTHNIQSTRIKNQ